MHITHEITYLASNTHKNCYVLWKSRAEQ